MIWKVWNYALLLKWVLYLTGKGQKHPPAVLVGCAGCAASWLWKRFSFKTL